MSGGGTRIATPAIAPSRRVASPSLIGRAAELARLVSAVSAPPALVVVEGEAGVGKTRLVSELSGRPELERRRLAMGACRRIREPFPLGPVIDALRAVPADLGQLPLSPVTGALRPLLPELEHLLPPQPPPLADRAAERHRVFRALVEVLAGLGPTVLVLEDLHWADEHTVDFLGYLLGGPPETLSLVLTFRAPEAAARVRALPARSAPPVGRAEITLTPLDGAGTGQLAAAIFGVDRVSEEFSGFLWERTGGLPFAVEEVVALLLQKGLIAPRPGGWARRALADLHVPSAIRHQVLERLDRLPAPARVQVDAVAVLQQPVPDQVVAEVSGRPREEAVAGLAEALEHGVLMEHAHGVGFRHLLAAQAVHDAIPGPARRELHGRAAEALQRLRPVPLGRVAHHLRQAGRMVEWAGAAERAADQARQLGDDGEAARLLQDVLRHGSLAPPARERIALALGRVAVEVVDQGDVVALLSEALRHDPPRTVRGELRMWLAIAMENAGVDPVRHYRLLRDAVDDLDDRPDLQAWAMIGLSVRRLPEVPPAEQAGWIHRAQAVLQHADDGPLKLYLTAKVGMELVPLGDPGWRDVLAQVLDRTGGSPTDARHLNAYWSLGTAACYAGHLDAADRLLAAALASPVVGHHRRLELRVQAAVAMLDGRRGAWDGLADRVARLLDATGELTEARVDLEIVTGWLALAHGDLDQAREVFQALYRAAEHLGRPAVLWFALAGLARVALARDGASEAIQPVLSQLAAADAGGLWAMAAPALPWTTKVLVAGGQPGQAAWWVDRLATRIAGRDVPTAAPALGYARAALAAGAGRSREAAELLLAAARGYDRCHHRYEGALAAEEAAGHLSGLGDHRAGATLAGALASYVRMGASWDAARAARLAREIGVPVPGGYRRGRLGYGTALSPRERQVATLAATGRTNREIAGELFLSPDTVKRHIRSAMRKLGVRSRVVLGAHLAEGAPSRPIE